MKILGMLQKHITNKKGSSSILFLITSVFFIGLLAFVVDAGMMYLEKSKLQNGVDAIALAAIQEYAKGETAMLSEAHRYADFNGIDIDSLQITFSDNSKKVTVVSNKQIQMYFAKILSFADALIEVKASAKVGPIAAANGIKPLAVEKQAFEFGKTYSIKKGAGGAYQGNYGALALGGTGASNYKDKLINGYNSKLEIGDLVSIGEDMETEPGNMSGPTYEGISYILEHDTCSQHDLSKLNKDCNRLVIIPVVDSLDVNGRSKVKIVGFARFFLEETSYEGGKTEVKGKFIKSLGQGEIDDGVTNFGMMGAKLVE